ncbi:hypothetical protein Peur_044145 [Populus x canadensis]
MHSATKFKAGHSDVMAGVLVVKGESSSCLPPAGEWTENCVVPFITSTGEEIKLCWSSFSSWT